MPVLVSGSLALDHIMLFPDRFKNHILPDKIHVLNVSFNISSLETHFGGVAGNISYHLRLLGEDPYIVATAGSDFGPYARWLEGQGVRCDWIRVLDDARTAQGFVTTDLDDNQIWAFHEGAMSRAHEARVEDVSEPFEFGVVSANGKRAMLEHARALKQRKVPVLIDPSHGLPILARDELVELIDGAAVYIGNDYELALTLERSGLDDAELQRRVETVVVTKGEQGSTIYEKGRAIEIPPVQVERVVDPTACGDAYRAGLVHGRLRGCSWETAGRIASLMGALVVGCEGTQSLKLDPESFRERYQREFGSPY